jgi:chromosome segregation ATPase
VSLPNDLCKTFPFFKDLRGVISSLEAFASQFTSLEAEKVRLQEEAKSSSSKLDGAIKKAAIARQEVDSLKDELSKLKDRLREEEARVAEKDDLLRQSALTLLGKIFHISLITFHGFVPSSLISFD